MMKRYLVYLFFSFSIFGCSNDEVIPEGIVVQDKMIEILIDMELAQAKIKFVMANENNGLKDNYHYFNEVFNKHQISREEFNTNLEYYCSQPLVMQDLYVEVIERLSEQQANQKQQ